MRRERNRIMKVWCWSNTEQKLVSQHPTNSAHWKGISNSQVLGKKEGGGDSYTEGE
jgi:hypothetical protein